MDMFTDNTDILHTVRHPSLNEIYFPKPLRYFIIFKNKNTHYGWYGILLIS